MFCLFGDTLSFMMFSSFSSTDLLLHSQTRSICAILNEETWNKLDTCWPCDKIQDVVVWVIVRVCSVVLRRTVVGVDWRFDNLSRSHHPLRLSKCQSTPTTVLHRPLHYKPGQSLKPQHWLTWVQTFHCYKIQDGEEYLHDLFSSRSFHICAKKPQDKWVDQTFPKPKGKFFVEIILSLKYSWKRNRFPIVIVNM